MTDESLSPDTLYELRKVGFGSPHDQWPMCEWCERPMIAFSDDQLYHESCEVAMTAAGYSFGNNVTHMPRHGRVTKPSTNIADE